MIDVPNFGRVGKEARALVQYQRILVPTPPQFVHDFQKFFGAIVTGLMLQMLLRAEVSRLTVIDRSDDIPGRAPVR